MKFLSTQYPCLRLHFDDTGEQRSIRFQPEPEGGPGAFETDVPAEVAYLTELSNRDATILVAD
jgi:hypothetical protein